MIEDLKALMLILRYHQTTKECAKLVSIERKEGIIYVTEILIAVKEFMTIRDMEICNTRKNKVFSTSVDQ